MLQHLAGNAAIAELVRIGGRRPPTSPALARRGFFGGAETDQERYDDAIEAKQRYIGRGKRGPEDFRSSTGLGGFNVAYDPESFEMKLLLRGSVDFLDGMELQAGIAIAKQPAASAATAASAINRLPPEQRAAAVADWQWAGGARSSFLARFEEVIRKIWSSQHIFHCTRPYWEDLGALPVVRADVHAGEKTGDDHMAMSVYRVPATFVGTVGVVNSGSGGLFGVGAARDNTMTLNSNDVEERADSILKVTTPFTAGSANLDPAGGAGLTQFAIRFQSGGPLCSLCGSKIEAVGGVAITATVRGDGADAEKNARDRFATLTAALVAAGMADAATRLQFAYGGAGNAADLVVGSGVAQMVAAHEAGHMFGLGDRYATTPGSGIGGTGPSAGLPSSHDQLAQGGGLGAAKAANDDGIMSWGGEVRPADYATFLEALKDVSGIDEWAFGPMQAVRPPGAPAVPPPGPPSGPGDFPTPAPQGTAVA